VKSEAIKGAISRRRALFWIASALCAPESVARAASSESQTTSFAQVLPGYRIEFPRDEGSHPEFRIEWWYITGWLNAATRPLGFQITFFRARPELRQDNPSTFTPRQIVVAHAALSDPAHGKLIHAQRAAREGFGLSGADRDRTRVWIDEWHLEQVRSAYHARIPAQDFSLELAFTATQAPLLQGANGYSRKGPAPESASYYYSLPHLRVEGRLIRGGETLRVGGAAWMDHEWSSQYLEQNATGWDWIGINLDGGAALMAFRIRDQQGASFWAGGTLRRADGSLRVFSPRDVRFTPRREWRSARTGTTYPVSWLVQAGDLEVVIEPLLDDQEQDTRASSGTIYWEGAVRAFRGGRPAGLGYLELTGYWRRLEL
jgi:predicted secreted hydrolase